METAATLIHADGIEDARARTLAVLGHQPSLRHAMYATLEFCSAPRTPAEVDAKVEPLIPGTSVYDAVILREWLESAGGLQRVGAGDDGAAVTSAETPLSDSAEAITGRLWLTTAAGRGVVEVQAPSRLLNQLLEGDLAMRPVYLQVLSFCLEPRTKDQIEKLLFDHPDLQTPRIYASYFINALGEVRAIEWKGMWSTTEIGSTVL